MLYYIAILKKITVVIKAILIFQTALSKINWDPSKEESLLNKKSTMQNKVKAFTEVIFLRIDLYKNMT